MTKRRRKIDPDVAIWRKAWKLCFPVCHGSKRGGFELVCSAHLRMARAAAEAE